MEICNYLKGTAGNIHVGNKHLQSPLSPASGRHQERYHTTRCQPDCKASRGTRFNWTRYLDNHAFYIFQQIKVSAASRKADVSGYESSVWGQSWREYFHCERQLDVERRPRLSTHSLPSPSIHSSDSGRTLGSICAL